MSAIIKEETVDSMTGERVQRRRFVVPKKAIRKTTEGEKTEIRVIGDAWENRRLLKRRMGWIS